MKTFDDLSLKNIESISCFQQVGFGLTGNGEKLYDRVGLFSLKSFPFLLYPKYTSVDLFLCLTNTWPGEVIFICPM